jgi:hypothetical protein
MKRIPLLFLLSVLVTACANLAAPTATVTPPATLTVSPSQTPTITPTSAPTLTPTLTLTPTKTPNPNQPADATGVDPTTGDYTKSVEENGKTTEYVWKPFQFGADAQNGITGHWFQSRMENGPINLLEPGETCQADWGGPYSLNMSVYAVEGLTDLNWLGKIYHPEQQAEWDKYKGLTGRGLGCTSIPLPNTILTDLFYRYAKLFPSASSENKHLRSNAFYPQTAAGGAKYSADLKAFVAALGQGKMSIKIGEELWFPTQGYEVYWLTEELASQDPAMEKLRDHYVKVMVQDGKLIAFIAATKLRRNDLVYGKKIYRELTFNSMILFPLEAAITNTFPIKNSSYYTPYDYYGRTGIPSGTVNNQYFYINARFIEFAPTK